MFASLKFAFHLPVRKLFSLSLMLVMLLLAGCGSSVDDPVKAAHDSYCASHPLATTDTLGVEC